MMWLVVHPSLVALPYSLRRGIIMGRRLPATNTVCLWWPVCWTTDPFAWYVKIEFGTIPEWWGAYLLYQAENCCCLTPACIYYLSLSSPTICETRLPIETYSKIPVNPCMGLREIMGMLQFFYGRTLENIQTMVRVNMWRPTLLLCVGRSRSFMDCFLWIISLPVGTQSLSLNSQRGPNTKLIDTFPRRRHSPLTRRQSRPV